MPASTRFGQADSFQDPFDAAQGRQATLQEGATRKGGFLRNEPNESIAKSPMKAPKRQGLVKIEAAKTGGGRPLFNWVRSDHILEHVGAFENGLEDFGGGEFVLGEFPSRGAISWVIGID